MRRPCLTGIVSLLVLVASCRNSTSREGAAVEIAAVVQSSPAVTLNATITTPHRVSPFTVALGSTSSLSIGSAGQVTAPGGAISIVTNMGSGGVDAEPDAVLGTVWSTSTVTLKDRVHLLGKVVAPKMVPGNNVTVAGGVDSTTPLLPATITTWSVTYPSAVISNVIVPVNGTASATPARYGAFQVFSGGTLKLSAGTYYIDSLDLESGSKLVLTQDTGPVILYVRNSVIFRGVVSTTTSGAAPDFLLGYFGTAGLIVEARFVGTIVAPSATVTLRSVTGGHTGAFFGANISLDSGAIVSFHAPQAILKALPPSSPDTCAGAIQPNNALTGKAREVQYQSDILRYCTGTGISACEQTIRARMNVDFFLSAASVLTSRMTTGTYQLVVTDRDSKLPTFRSNPTLACDVAAHDADGDYVPDDQDACPNTPPLTPVLANGCTNHQVLVGADINALQNSTKYLGINVDPRCANAPRPAVPTPLGAFRSGDPSLGKAIWISRDPYVTNCPLNYQVEAQLTDGAGPRPIMFQASEDTVLPWITRPSGAVQFNIHSGDAGNRGAWANYGVFTVTFRVRALNMAGSTSDWSDFFVFNNADCVAGQPCQDL